MVSPFEFDIYTAPALAVHILCILMLISLAIANYWQLRVRRAVNKYVVGMFLVILSSSVADLAFYYFLDRAGRTAHIMLYALNSWLYITDMLITYLYVSFMLVFYRGENKKRQLYLTFGIWIGTAMVIYNLFNPFIFQVTEINYLERLPGFDYMINISNAYILIMALVYMFAKKDKEKLKFFSFWGVYLPIFFALFAVSYLQSVSLEWCAMAIALGGILSSMQKEVLYRDSLTGCYNRLYMEHLYQEMKDKDEFVYGVLIDLNSFKKINDDYGHSVGDQALIETARILDNAVGDRGNVCRYAGDEFIVLVKSNKMEVVDEICTAIRNLCQEHNKEHIKVCAYNLSPAMGIASFYPFGQSLDDFIKIADTEMYKDKNNFYRLHCNDRRKR